MLRNKKGSWQFQDIAWTNLPKEGSEDSIIDSSGKVLESSDDGMGSLMVLRSKGALSDVDQKWYQKTVTDDNHFTLQNSISKRFLFSKNPNLTTTTGNLSNNTSLFIDFYS